jgi:predicted DNA-binding protein
MSIGGFMANSVILRLPYSIVEKLSRKAKKLDMSVEEYVIELISSSLDPLEIAHEYIEASLGLLEQAIEEVKRGDIRQGAKKLWAVSVNRVG